MEKIVVFVRLQLVDSGKKSEMINYFQAVNANDDEEMAF
jgi:hypothetical protein